MVAGDVVVQVFPEAFDAIVIWAVGRQEVQLHTVAPAELRGYDSSAAVDAEVVEHQVNRLPKIGAASEQMIDEGDEQRARFLRAVVSSGRSFSS